MPRALFEKMIDDLVAVDFSRSVSFHFYNEPLMDERLPELVAHAVLASGRNSPIGTSVLRLR